MPYFKSKDSCRIYYEHHDFDSANPVVVFLNGTTQTTRTWGLTVRRLKKRIRFLLYDARGQGHSDMGPSDLTLDGHVDDLLQLLDHLAVNRAHIVGLSHGARVACRFGALNPERTGRMILCGLGRNLDSRTTAFLNSWIHILNSGGFEAMLWGRNINNDEYLMSAFPAVAQNGSFSGYPNQPRTYGLTVRKYFD